MSARASTSGRALDLLGRHVRRRADEHPDAVRGAAALERVGEGAGDAEVGDHHAPVAGEQHVVGLEVAVDHAGGVGAADAARRLRRPRRGPAPAGSAPERARAADSDSPSTSSMVRNFSPSCSPMSKTRATFLWVTRRASFTSRRKRSRMPGVATSSRRSTLSATISSSSRSRARYTVPMPPRRGARGSRSAPRGAGARSKRPGSRRRTSPGRSA